MLPRPSITMSFQPCPRPFRSAWVTSEPSGFKRSSSPCLAPTITSCPSGCQAVQTGNESTRATTSCLPSRSSAITSPAVQSEKYRRLSCQRGDSTSPRPVSHVCSSDIVDSLPFVLAGTSGPAGPRAGPGSAVKQRSRRGKQLACLEPGLQAGQDHRPAAVEFAGCPLAQLVVCHGQAAGVADRLDFPSDPRGALALHFITPQRDHALHEPARRLTLEGLP